MKMHFAAALLALLSGPVSADTLVHNINGIQVGANGELQRFGALLISDDGKVVRTYPLGGLPTQAKELVDGDGRTLLPGLIDAHGHVMGLGTAAMQLDLTGTRSVDELKQRLKDYAAANPDAPWILGRGWNQELWPEKRMPTAADLDAVVTGRPVWLERVDGHASVGNSAAMRAAGVSAASADPTGGKIERDSTGNPTGLFIDTAAALVGRAVPAPTAAEQDRALTEAQAMLLANGLTTVADMGTSLDDWTTIQRAGNAGKLNLRIISYAAGLAPLERIREPTEWLHGDRLRMIGVKLYSDGALGSRGAWLKQPYADANTRGLRFLTDAQLREQTERAASAGFQLAVHAIGDAANAQVIGAFEDLSRSHGTDRRWRIEHFQIADPTDIGRLGKVGIIASMQPTHQTSDRTMAEARLGPGRLDGAYAWQSVLRSGARIAFGSDFPVEHPNPFPGLAAAVSRQNMQGQPPGAWMPHERVTFAQALSGFTRDAAYAGFSEDRIGSLEPGKWADFIIIDRDVSGVSPLELGKTEVLQTWVAGRKVWERAPTERGERGK